MLTDKGSGGLVLGGRDGKIVCIQSSDVRRRG